jgi:hypothetical protein
MYSSGFWFLGAEDRSEVGWFGCRRVVFSIERLSSATPDPEARMEAVGYPGLAGAPGSMPLLNSCLVISLSAGVSGICPEMGGHDGLCLCLNYICRPSASGRPLAGTSPGNPHGKATIGSDQYFRILLLLG